MAITVTMPTNAKNWIPSGNPIIYKFKTDNTLPDLSYIIDVNINSSSVCQLKYPVYDRNNMTINLHNVVNDYIKDAFTNDYPGFATTGADTLKLELDLWEQNGSTAPVSAGVAKEIYVWYAAADFQKSRRLWDYWRENDLIGSGYDNYGRFLGVKNYCIDVAWNSDIHYGPPYYYFTKPEVFKNLYKIGPGTRRSMSFFTTSSYTGGSKHTQIMNCWCCSPDFKITKQFGLKLHNGSWTDTQYNRKVAAIPVGPEMLNTITWTDTYVEAGYSSIITPDEDRYYFITVSDYSDAATTILDIDHTPAGYKWVGFELVPCSRYKVYNILYQTTEGGWWQIRADRKHFNETAVETSVKYNSWGVYGPYGQSPATDFTMKRTMHTDAGGSITLNTDWINNQGLIQEIEDMIISPRIYLVEDVEPGAKNPVYTPVVLKDTTHKIWNKNQEKMVQYEFEFEEGYKKFTLR